jgi:hypothetical protein
MDNNIGSKLTEYLLNCEVVLEDDSDISVSQTVIDKAIESFSVVEDEDHYYASDFIHYLVQEISTEQGQGLLNIGNIEEDEIEEILNS